MQTVKSKGCSHWLLNSGNVNKGVTLVVQTGGIHLGGKCKLYRLRKFTLAVHFEHGSMFAIHGARDDEMPIVNRKTAEILSAVFSAKTTKVKPKN